MADPNRIAGTASITVDGNSFSIAGEGTYRPSGSKREALGGQDDPLHGFSEMPVYGSIKWKGRVSNTTVISAINEASNATVTLVEATGKMVTGTGMSRIGDPIEVNTEDGTFEVEFAGRDVYEILP